MQESDIQEHIDHRDTEGMLELIKRFKDKDYKFALSYSAAMRNPEFFELIIDHYFYSPIELRHMRIGKDENDTLLKFLIMTGNLSCLTILLNTQKKLSAKKVHARSSELSLESEQGTVDLDYLLPAEFDWALDLFLQEKLPCFPALLENPKHAARFQIILVEAVESGSLELLLKIKELGVPMPFSNPQHLVHTAINMEKDAPGITEVVLASSPVQYSKLRFANGNSIVHHCLNQGFYSLLSYLLYRIRADENLAFLEVKNNDNLTPLALACCQHDMKALHFFQCRSLFESPDVLDYVNTVRDGKSLAWHIITSCLVNDEFLLVIVNVLDANYRDPEGKSYLQLLCEQKYFAENVIRTLMNKHPSLINTLTPYALTRCLSREESGLAQDVVLLATNLPPKIALSEELRSCDVLKKAVLKCCKPWSFIKLLQVMQDNMAHPSLTRVLEILSGEAAHPEYRRTEYQRATLAAIVADDSDDADFLNKRQGITEDLLTYWKTPNFNAPRVDGFLMAILSSKNMEQLNARIHEQVQIHSGVKIVLPAHEETCPEHLKPMRYPNIKKRYWELLVKWEQPQEVLDAHPK